MSKSVAKGARSNRPSLRNLNPVFHKRDKSEDDGELSVFLWKQARRTGVLKLSGKGLTSVPEKVYEINESDKDVEVTLESLVAREEDAWWNQMELTNLDLSSNSLVELSPMIQNLYSLTVLSLHDNLLTSIPKEIATLEKLTRINLSRNNLKELPTEFFTLPELRYLNISNNDFEELNPDISDLHMLEFLDVSHNELKSIPCGIGFLVRVTQLLLAHNKITELPTDLVDMRSLQKLDLTHNELRKMPEDMGNLRKLQCLYLQHNNIEAIPSFDGCVDLQEIYLANNYLSRIPRSFCSKLPHLKILDLRDNKIIEIPEEIALLSNLRRLDLTNNSIDSLPCSLATLGHLANLQVEGNPIKTIRRDILQCGTSRILKTLRERAAADSKPHPTSSNDSSPTSPLSPTSSFKMGADGLNSPRIHGASSEDASALDKYKMRKTHTINLTMQNLTDVPDKIFEMGMQETVNTVDFSKNRLESLPNGLKLMSNCVTELVAANNQIKEVPIYLSQFTRITLLNLSCNMLRELPNEISLLNTLRELNICNNRFEEVPPSVYGMNNLEILLASDNRIKSIDASAQGLGALKHLAILDLRNNNIEQVPPILGNLKNINTLELMGNPFRQPRHQVIQKGTEAIMSYLRDRIPA